MTAEPIDFAADLARLHEGRHFCTAGGHPLVGVLMAEDAPPCPIRVLAVEVERLTAAGSYDNLVTSVKRAEDERDAARRQVNFLADELRVWQRKHVDKVVEVERLAGKVASMGEAIKDTCWKATQYGKTADGDTLAYILPKGTVHRLIAAAQSAGIPAAFRVAAPTLADQPEQEAEPTIEIGGVVMPHSHYNAATEHLREAIRAGVLVFADQPEQVQP